MRPKAILLIVVLGMPMGLKSDWGQANEYLGTFETVWGKVNATYFDAGFGGLNWKDARDRYLTQITAAQSDEEFYGLVNRMLWELNVSHANLVPPGFLARREPLVCAEGGPGMDIRMLDGAAVVTSVTPGSPAQNAGLRSGYVLQAVDGTPVDEIVREAELVLRPPRNGRNRIALVTKAILGRLYGRSGTEVSVSYADEGGNRREAKIVRARRRGRAVGPGGILYLAVEFEARRLDNGIGYIRLNTFQPPLVAQVSGAIRSLGSLRGLVFDLRGNSGGEIEGMPGLFLSERAVLFLSRSRSGETKVFVDPADDVYKGPLVLLVDRLSGSASELFAGCLQAIGRAVIVGERSPGAVVESDMDVLPHGAIFMYPVAQLATPDGTVLEGRGVVPDIEIGLDREMLLEGIDSQLQSAITHLKTKMPR